MDGSLPPEMNPLFLLRREENNTLPFSKKTYLHQPDPTHPHGLSTKRKRLGYSPAPPPPISAVVASPPHPPPPPPFLAPPTTTSSTYLLRQDIDAAGPVRAGSPPPSSTPAPRPAGLQPASAQAPARPDKLPSSGQSKAQNRDSAPVDKPSWAGRGRPCCPGAGWI